jgi:hypothetical protein
LGSMSEPWEQVAATQRFHFRVMFATQVRGVCQSLRRAAELGVRSWTGFDPELTLCWQSLAQPLQVPDY